MPMTVQVCWSHFCPSYQSRCCRNSISLHTFWLLVWHILWLHVLCNNTVMSVSLLELNFLLKVFQSICSLLHLLGFTCQFSRMIRYNYYFSAYLHISFSERPEVLLLHRLILSTKSWCCTCTFLYFHCMPLTRILFLSLSHVNDDMLALRLCTELPAEDHLQMMQVLVHMLLPAAVRLLKQLLSLLKRVCDHEESRMTAASLGRLFAPHLLIPRAVSASWL